MPSFFTTFLEKYTRAVQENRSGGMDLGGRYLALILKEVLRENPALVKAVLPEFPMKIRGGRQAENFSVETEIQFRTDEKKKEKRSADLEVKYGGRRGFVEIKWKDSFLPGQLDDYIEYCSEQEVDFSILYLRPESFTREEEDTIAERKIHRVSCRELHAALTGREGNVTNLFKKFLEDHIMEYKEKIQRGALLTIMKTGLNWKNSDGLGRLAGKENLDAIPDTWKILLTNAKAIADRLYDKIRKTHKDVLGNAPVLDVNFRPCLDAESLKKHLCKDGVKCVAITEYGDNNCYGDELWMHSEGGHFHNCGKVKLKPDDWGLEFGVYFCFRPEPKHKPKDGGGAIDFGVFSGLGKEKYWKTEYSEMERIPLMESSEKYLSIPGEDAVFAGIVEIITKNLENLKTDKEANISPETIEKLLSALS